MATLYISEYADSALDGKGRQLPNVPNEPSLAEQVVSIGASSAQSALFNSATRFVRIHADSTCSISLGVNPTATTGVHRLAAGQTEMLGVSNGTPPLRLAVIANS